MKREYYLPFCYAFLLCFVSFIAGAAPVVNLTTQPVAAANVNQGTASALVYMIKIKVSTAAVTISNIQYTFSGTHDANDLTNTYVYFNTTPTLTSASYLGGTTATFAAPHTYSVGIFKAFNANDSGYFIITANIATDATDGKTISVLGSINPVVFTYSTAVNLTGTQTNGGIQTIQAPDVKMSNSPVAAGNVNQGTANAIIDIVKMKVTTEPLVVNNVQYTFTGTQDANDLTNTYVYFNTTPTLSGASYLGGTAATFAAPNTYSVGVYKPLNTGDSGYFIITANISPTATDNKTISITGKTKPVVFGFTTAPNVTGAQTNTGIQTIQAPDVKLSNSPVAAGNLNQGTSNAIVYIVKMKVTTEPLVVSNIQYTFSGTHDANDLTNTYVYFNTTPTLASASYLGGTVATFAAPHTYSVGVYKPLNTGDSGYFIITVNVSPTATDGKIIKITGATTPVVFGFTTAPNVTGTQANSGIQTIQAPDVKLSNSPVAAGNVNQGTSNAIIGIVKMKVTTEPLVVNNVQYTFSGTQDGDDLSNTYVYFNTTPTLTSASYLGGTVATFAAPHTYSVGVYKPLNAGDSGYFIITANVSPTATDNKTISITGSTKPVVFGFTTAPNVTGAQANTGIQTIQAPDVTVASSTVAAGNIAQGSSNNIVYIASMGITTEPGVVNNIQYTLSGTQDADDLPNTFVYFNTTPSLTGASYLGGTAATFAAPHTYSVGVYKPLNTGDNGYFIITVNVSSTATIGKKVNINGSTTPVLFGFTTAPNITNNQTNAAGVKTIVSSFSPVAMDTKQADNIAGIQPAGIYPNPANTVAHISLFLNSPQQGEIVLVNESGITVLRKTFTASKTNNQVNLDVHALKEGFYFINVLSKGQTVQAKSKLLIKH